MKLIKLKIDDIKPYENNPRKNDEAVNAVVESIKQCSYITPIIVDENHVIIAGHTRYKALKVLKYEEVECLIIDDLDETTKKKYRYLDNKTGEKATWDIMKLEQELQELDLGDFDFFMMDDSVSSYDVESIESTKEFDIESFDDGKYKYECPKCGFKFN